MFNSIYSDLLCPDIKQVSKNTEIQIKWQKPESRTLNVYQTGDTLGNIEDEYNNNWIRTDYICKVCSKKTKGQYGDFIKVADQQRHYVFIHIKESRICEILTEKEFKQKGIKTFVKYW